MKKILLTLAAAAFCCSAWAETAVFDFTAENPWNWNSLKKDKDNYLLNDQDKRDVKLPITEAPVTIELNGKMRRQLQRAYGALECLCVYQNTSLTFTCADGYKMTDITIYSATNKIPSLQVTEGETTLEEAVETGVVYNHSETGVELAQITRSAMCNTAGPIVITDTENVTGVITSIEVTYEASTLKDADLKWSLNEFTAYLVQDNAFPTLTKATTAPIDYMSENEEVATVDATTGAITLVAPGETKIIAGCDAADGFDWAEASYILTVKRQGEISAVYNFQDFTIDSDTKLGYMTDYPDIPYDGNKSFWWTTNPNEEGTYAAGSQFKPLTITNEGTQLTFQWGGISGHGNLRATTTSKVNNLQLGGGTAIAIKPTVADATLYDVVVYINNGNSKFDQTVDGLETNDEGTISSDTEANTITWTPKTDNSECYLDFEGGAYITKISVNYKKAASSGITAPAISEDTEVPAEYFNLQGIRVANPANGLFIKRQGKTATKVFIK